ncbi:MAG: hypothetical protein NUV88_00080 [Candidatus Kaiserbacteria bacterium]|nr:hypothetical protein [Candidatus Kaiserbacteria bacterium]
MIATDPHYHTQAPQLDLFQENLERLLAEGVGIRNPELIARKARREAAYTEALRMIHDTTLQSVVFHAKMQKLARELKKT